MAGLAGLALVAGGVFVVVFSYTQFRGSDAQAAQFQQDLVREFALRQEAGADVGEGADDGGTTTTAAIQLTVKDNPLMVIPAEDLAGDTTATTVQRTLPEAPGIEIEERPPPGDAAGRIVIPKADVEWVIVEGISLPDLQRGPGHWPNTPMPGQPGNAVISGHRTTYGAPFGDLDLLEPGDPIVVETLLGTHTYEVVGSRIVLPREVWVADQRDGAWLTLTTCNPRYSSRERLVVFARLVLGPNAAAVAAEYGWSYELPEPPEG